MFNNILCVQITFLWLLKRRKFKVIVVYLLSTQITFLFYPEKRTESDRIFLLLFSNNEVIRKTHPQKESTDKTITSKAQTVLILQ